MHQIPHTYPTHWPLPMGSGVLVEVDFGKIMTEHIQLLDGGVRNMATATVRAVSPFLSKDHAARLLPDGVGTFGARIVISEPNLRYLEEAEYQACGFDVPSPKENAKGDLAFINYDRIIAFMEQSETNNLPFSPLGRRVFFEYEMDDESEELIEVGDAGLLIREKDAAVENQLAVVTGVGPEVDYLSAGDRIIVRRNSSSLSFEGKQYYFVSTENEIFAVLGV